MVIYTKVLKIGHGALGFPESVGGVGGVGGWGRNLSPHTPHTPHISPLPHGSTQRPSALIKLINSSTPLSSGTFFISSLPRYKEM